MSVHSGLKENPSASLASFGNTSDPCYKRSVAQVVAAIKLRSIFKIKSNLASMKLKQTLFTESKK